MGTRVQATSVNTPINRIISISQLIAFLTGNLLLAKIIVPIGLLLLNSTAIAFAIKGRKKKIGYLIGAGASIVFIIFHKQVLHPEPGVAIALINLAWIAYLVSTIWLMVQYRQERAEQQRELERIRQARIEKRKRLKEQEVRARRQYAAYWKRRRKEEEQARLQAEREAFSRLVESLLTFIRKDYTLAIDTNVLLDEGSLHFIEYVLKEHRLPIMVSKVVLQELDGKKNAQGKLGARAREAIRLFERLQVEQKGQLQLIDIPPPRFLHRHSLDTSPDDRILAGYLQEMQKGNKPVLFMTKDRMVRIKARDLQMGVFHYDKEKERAFQPRKTS